MQVQAWSWQEIWNKWGPLVVVGTTVICCSYGIARKFRSPENIKYENVCDDRDRANKEVKKLQNENAALKLQVKDKQDVAEQRKQVQKKEKQLQELLEFARKQGAKEAAEGTWLEAQKCFEQACIYHLALFYAYPDCVESLGLNGMKQFVQSIWGASAENQCFSGNYKDVRQQYDNKAARPTGYLKSYRRFCGMGSN